MRESTIVAEWKAEGRAEGIAEGIALERAKGIAEGIAQGERQALLMVLEQKFGAPVPADLASTIEPQADTDILLHWLAHAIAVESLEAFRTAIAGPGNGLLTSLTSDTLRVPIRFVRCSQPKHGDT